MTYTIDHIYMVLRNGYFWYGWYDGEGVLCYIMSTQPRDPRLPLPIGMPVTFIPEDTSVTDLGHKSLHPELFI